MDGPGAMELKTQRQTERVVNPRPYKLIAPWWHTVSVILILGFFAYRGAQQQDRPSPLGGAVGASSTSFVLQYLLLIGAELLHGGFQFGLVIAQGFLLFAVMRIDDRFHRHRAGKCRLLAHEPPDEGQ